MARALTALSIGPLLPDGRDGLVAELKVYSALGLHGAAVATVVAGEEIGGEAVVTQIEAVLDVIRVDAVKLACPANPELLEAIAECLDRYKPEKLVLSPGAAAASDRGAAILRERLLPLTLLTIVDRAEAQVLTGLTSKTWEDMRQAAQAIAAMGTANVVVKGGKDQAEGRLTDLLFDGADYRDFTAPRVELAGVSGAGATFAAAIAATLAKGETMHHAVAAGKAYVTKTLQSTYDLGGPVALHHFYRYWRASAS